jgi:hypothetical protein
MTKPDKSGRTLMEAIICTKDGSPDVIQPKEVEKPNSKDNKI